MILLQQQNMEIPMVTFAKNSNDRSFWAFMLLWRECLGQLGSGIPQDKT